eukprot:scaffold48885_cov56-Phaeocystis_antarctica.AAC.3
MDRRRCCVGRRLRRGTLRPIFAFFGSSSVKNFEWIRKALISAGSSERRGVSWTGDFRIRLQRMIKGQRDAVNIW